MSDPQRTLLDRLIGWASPAAGLSRYYDRLRLQRAYEAASPRDRWKPRRGGASANADHLADASIIRTKARALVQNVPYVAAGLEALVANTVGTGISTYSKAAGETAAQSINATWSAWGKVCDADGRLDWFGIQAAAYRAMEQDGEVLIRLRPRLSADGLPVPLQIQLLEIDWIDASRQTGASGSNQIINGIEYDMLGRVAAYWLWDQHPGDASMAAGRLRIQSKRVPAESIVHLYGPDRPGQGRGFSRLAPVIARVRDLQLYEDAELARKNLESRLSVLATGDVASMANPVQYGGQPDADKAAQSADLGPLASGGITMLPPGLNITTVAPNPAPGYTDYIKQQLHIIAVGMGVTYEMLTGDMKEVNFSSSRVRQADFRRQVEARQWLCLVPRLIEPVWRAFINAGVLGSKWRRADYACDHSMPKWDYVNPQQDANSELTLIGSGLLTISESLRRRGYKPEDVFAELKSDFDTLEQLGVLKTLLAMQGKQMPGAQPADANASAGRSSPVVDFGDAVINVTKTESVRAPDVHVHVPPQAPAPVNVNVHEREQPAPTVTIPVTVQPAAVDVRVQATIPARRTETDIQVNDRGDIVRTVSIEKAA